MTPPASLGERDTRAEPHARLTPALTGLAVAALCIIILAFYYGLWWPDLVLIKRDAFRLFLPIKQYLVQRLSTGELPQWFPYDALGRPFIGATHTGVFHPLNVLYFVFPAPDAYRASILISCLLAATGAFLFSRTLLISLPGAVLAGVAFALSGYLVSLTENIHVLYSIGALPFFCVALEKALTERYAWTVAPAAIWATVFLNGDVQTGYYYGFIALAWVLARTTTSYRHTLPRLALAGTLAVLLAGVQLGPAWGIFHDSERTRPGEYLEQAMSWSTHPLRLVTMLAWPVATHASPVLVARTFGIPTTGFLAESLYLGIPVMGLALLGTWHRRDLRILAVLGGAALLLALGQYGGLYEIFYHVMPLWSAFRYPEKLMGVASFAAAMLAGAGLDALWSRKGLPAAWLATAILCAAAGFALRTDAAAAGITAHFGAAPELAHEIAHAVAIAFLYSAAVTLGTWLIAAGAQRQVLQASVALPLLVLLITLDLARANQGAYHTGPSKAATFMPPLAEAITAREGPLTPGRFRLVATYEESASWPEDLARTAGYYGALSIERRQALDVLHNAAFQLESVMPQLAGYSRQFADAMRHGMNFEVGARYNVTYYISRRYHVKNPHLSRMIVAELPPYNLVLFRNPVPPKPRVYLSRKPELSVKPVDPAVLFVRPDFQSGEVDVIEARGHALPGPAAGGAASIEQYKPEDVRVRVTALQPAVLVLLDAFDKGWAATLDDGTDLPIMRANALVRAVVVPSGTHIVTFAYQTPLLKAGAWASLAGLVICLGLLAQARRETHRAMSHP
ncbi:MAG: hypothetical protein EPO02_02965 [Nitrospirae bacterium]|nr:MAG: hypothetical protein EPO02_02965 [Nitrospirota bacterium]